MWLFLHGDIAYCNLFTVAIKYYLDFSSCKFLFNVYENYYFIFVLDFSKFIGLIAVIIKMKAFFSFSIPNEVISSAIGF